MANQSRNDFFQNEKHNATMSRVGVGHWSIEEEGTLGYRGERIKEGNA